MNMRADIQGFSPPTYPKKANLFRRLIAFLARIISGPKGDQGGWEGGARGL
jgi:hypothetical protein